MKKYIEIPTAYTPVSYNVTADSVIVKAYDSLMDYSVQAHRTISIKVIQLPGFEGRYFADLVPGEEYPGTSIAAEILESLPAGLLDSLYAAKVGLADQAEAYRKEISELILAGQVGLEPCALSGQEVVDIIDKEIKAYPGCGIRVGRKSVSALFGGELEGESDISISIDYETRDRIHNLALDLTACGIKLDIVPVENFGDWYKIVINLAR